MRRPVIAVAGTASGLVLVLSYHASTRPAPTADVVVAAPPPTPTAPTGAPIPTSPPSGLPSTTSAPSVPPSAAVTPVPSRSSALSRSSGPAPARTTPPATVAAPSSAPVVAASRMLTGGVAETRYGPVQVQITVTGQRITAARALQQPDANGQDAAIAAYAVPRLNQEVLAAQGAHIDAVSGATYTSEGYIGSLQSALDAGHLG